MLPAPRPRAPRRRWRPPSGRPRAARSRSRRSRSARPTAARTPRGVAKRRGSRTPSARPVHARGVLGHVAHRRADDDRAAVGERAHQRAVAAVADDDVARRHRLRVRQPRHQHGVGAARAIGGSGSRPFQVAITRTRLARQALQRGAQQPVLAVLRGRGRDEHDRPVARRRLDALAGRLPHQRPDDARPRPASRAGTRAAAAWRPASARARGRVHPRPAARRPSRRAASLSSSRPCSQRRARRSGRSRARQSRAPEPRARQPRADRVEREARRHVRVHVRDERRHGHARQLRRQRRRPG